MMALGSEEGGLEFVDAGKNAQWDRGQYWSSLVPNVQLGGRKRGPQEADPELTRLSSALMQNTRASRSDHTRTQSSTSSGLQTTLRSCVDTLASFFRGNRQTLTCPFVPLSHVFRSPRLALRCLS